jgi:hypothetical protein
MKQILVHFIDKFLGGSSFAFLLGDFQVVYVDTACIYLSPDFIFTDRSSSFDKKISDLLHLGKFEFGNLRNGGGVIGAFALKKIRDVLRAFGNEFFVTSL